MRYGNILRPAPAPKGAVCAVVGFAENNVFGFADEAHNRLLCLKAQRGPKGRKAARRPFGPSGVTESGPKALWLSDREAARRGESQRALGAIGEADVTN